MPVPFVNALGMGVTLFDHGATLGAVSVPGRDGVFANVVLGLSDEEAYRRSRQRWGIMGRYAGRLSGPDGVILHGEPDPFDRRVWKRRNFEDSCSLGAVFSLETDDGLTVEATWRLMKQDNRLRLECRAETRTPTFINLTSHGFFNLAGAGSDGVASHRLTIAADRYAETDERKVPTGRLLPVDGTPLDFRRPASMGERLAEMPDAFDHSLVFTDSAPGLKDVLIVDEPVSGRRMEIATTEPSMQFFSGNNFDGSEGYRQHDGLAFETQHLPDSPNQPHFPSTELKPGGVFHSVTSFRFSTLP